MASFHGIAQRHASNVSQANGPRPAHFIVRTSAQNPRGVLVPLIAVDELPPNLRIPGVSRELRSVQEAVGMVNVGIFSASGVYYHIEDENASGHFHQATSVGPLALSQPLGQVNQSYPLQMDNQPILSASGRALWGHAQSMRIQEHPDPKVTQEMIDAITAAASGVELLIPEQRRARPKFTADGNLIPDKVYCTHWVYHGECAFMHGKGGCKYKHEMPTDPDTMKQLCLRQIPKWWLDKQNLASSRTRWRELETDNGETGESSFVLPPPPPATALGVRPRSDSMKDSTQVDLNQGKALEDQGSNHQYKSPEEPRAVQSAHALPPKPSVSQYKSSEEPRTVVQSAHALPPKPSPLQKQTQELSMLAVAPPESSIILPTGPATLTYEDRKHVQSRKAVSPEPVDASAATPAASSVSAESTSQSRPTGEPRKVRSESLVENPQLSESTQDGQSPPNTFVDPLSPSLATAVPDSAGLPSPIRQRADPTLEATLPTAFTTPRVAKKEGKEQQESGDDNSLLPDQQPRPPIEPGAPRGGSGRAGRPVGPQPRRGRGGIYTHRIPKPPRTKSLLQTEESALTDSENSAAVSNSSPSTMSNDDGSLGPSVVPASDASTQRPWQSDGASMGPVFQDMSRLELSQDSIDGSQGGVSTGTYESLPMIRQNSSSEGGVPLQLAAHARARRSRQLLQRTQQLQPEQPLMVQPNVIQPRRYQPPRHIKDAEKQQLEGLGSSPSDFLLELDRA